MPAEQFFAQSVAEVGLNPDKVQALIDRAERDVKEGVLPACQIAIARKGKIAAMQTFGRAVQGGIEKLATDETVFVAMSCDQGDHVICALDSDAGRKNQSGRSNCEVRAGVWNEWQGNHND